MIGAAVSGRAVGVRGLWIGVWATAAALLITAPVSAQSGDATGQGRAVITVFAKHSEMTPAISPQDVSAKVNGKDAGVTSWTPLRGANGGLELVVLIDGGARNLGRQFEEIKQFIQGLRPDTKAAVGYMENGRAILASPLSADHVRVAGEIHLPAGPSSSPYFSLSDLAQHWPSQARGVRREVVLISDGIDPNIPRFDPSDQYVASAINDSVRAGLVVYTIYWQNRSIGGNSNDGQSLMSEVTQATGGNGYWTGSENPVSFGPFLDDLTRRLDNQYELDFAARLDRKPTIESFKFKVTGMALEVASPQQVYVDRRTGNSE
jgi:hypothetical protein